MADEIIFPKEHLLSGASAAQRAQQIWSILVGWVVFGGKYLQENGFFEETDKLSPRIITFSPNQYGESHLRWPVITYGDLARIMGYEQEQIGLIASSLDHPLYRIHQLCKKNNLPILNSIVVNQKTGVPGEGYPDWDEGGVQKWENECQRVMCYKKWTLLPVPTLKQFEDVVKD